jgi:hypothetical protein
VDGAALDNNAELGEGDGFVRELGADAAKEAMEALAGEAKFLEAGKDLQLEEMGVSVFFAAGDEGGVFPTGELVGGEAALAEGLGPGPVLWAQLEIFGRLGGHGWMRV